MTSNIKAGLAASALAVILAVAASSLAAAPPSISRSEEHTSVVTVKSIDAASHSVVLVNADGETMSLKLPADSRALTTLKSGDKIKATYVRETELVLSPPNKPLPADAQTVALARAESGPPGAVAANRIVVTGAVVGIDMATHTLKLVSPKGGEVHTIAVKRPEGQAALAKLKKGDKITAYVTEALLISASPAAPK